MTSKRKKDDLIVYEFLTDNSVIDQQISLLDLQYFQAFNSIMNEWESEDDEQAYKNL